MIIQETEPGGSALALCGYAGSRLRFRAPARSLDGSYVAALGGAETFGKGVPRPWPHLLEAMTGQQVVNFGAVGAGPEAMAHDLGLIAACRRARAVVVQLNGAGQVSNPLYRVHPRRNDRFVDASPALRALWPDIDFADYSFTGQLLDALHMRDRERFAEMAVDLRASWVERMAELLDRLSGGASPVVLLWLRNRPARRCAHPPLIDRTTIMPLVGRSAGLVVAPPPGGRMVPSRLAAAATHDAAAEALAPLVMPSDARRAAS